MRETFVEEMLVILQLPGKTRGEDMIKAVMDYFVKKCVRLNKLLSVPVMVGSKKGLIYLLRTKM